MQSLRGEDFGGTGITYCHSSNDHVDGYLEQTPGVKQINLLLL